MFISNVLLLVLFRRIWPHLQCVHKETLGFVPVHHHPPYLLGVHAKSFLKIDTTPGLQVTVKARIKTNKQTNKHSLPPLCHIIYNTNKPFYVCGSILGYRLYTVKQLKQLKLLLDSWNEGGQLLTFSLPGVSPDVCQKCCDGTLKLKAGHKDDGLTSSTTWPLQSQWHLFFAEC